MEKGILYQHYCSHCFAITGKRFEHPKRQCLRFTVPEEGGEYKLYENFHYFKQTLALLLIHISHVIHC